MRSLIIVAVGRFGTLTAIHDCACVLEGMIVLLQVNENLQLRKGI